MDSIYKVYSVQSETITETNNLLDFDLPAGQVFDLSKSYVSINCRMSATHASANLANSIFNVSGAINAGNNDVSRYEKSCALVKNAQLNSQVAGKVEELRDVNLLRSFLNNIYEPQTVFLNDEYSNLMGIRHYEDWGNISPLIDVSSEEGSTGRFIDKNLQIPLSDILNVGQVKQFDTRRLGKCRLSLELAMDRLSARGDNHNENYFSTLNNGTLVNQAGGAGGAELTSAVLARGGGAAAKVYDDDYQEHIPYYVGMPVKTVSGAFDGTDTGGTAVGTVFTEITDIAYAPTTGQITLTFGTKIGDIPANKTTADIKIAPINHGDLATATITLTQAELQLHSLGANNMGSVPQSINFTTYSVERDNASGNATFKRQYEMEPEAINTIVLIKANSDSIFSDNAFDGGSRVAIDNELTTNRLIDFHTPIYYNQLNKFSLNQGKMAQNVIGKNYLRTAPTNNRDIGNENALSFVVEPLPITNRMKLVEFEINDTGGVNDISVYKEVLKTI